MKQRRPTSFEKDRSLTQIKEPDQPNKSILDREVLPPIAVLRAFDAVSRLGGIRRAATALGLDHAAISRHIQSLEDSTGAALIDRSRYGAMPTMKGEQYHREITVALAIIARATRSLRSSVEEKVLHIRCETGFAVQWLLRRIQSFEDVNLDIRVEVHLSDIGQDLSSPAPDIDIRYTATFESPPEIPTMMRQVVLSSPPVIPVTSPAYLACSPKISTPDDLLALSLIHEDSDASWRAWFDAKGVRPIKGGLPGTRLWDANLTVDAARRGRGVVLTNYFLAGEGLASGALVEVGKDLPGFHRQSLGDYILLTHKGKWALPSVSRFRRWLVSTIEAEALSFTPP